MGLGHVMAQTPVFVPILSLDALDPIKDLTSDLKVCDDLLMEFRLALEMQERGLVETLYRLMVGVPECETISDLNWNKIKKSEFDSLDFASIKQCPNGQCGIGIRTIAFTVGSIRVHCSTRC